MSVDTDGKINAKYGVKDIQRALKNKFNIESKVMDTYSKDFYQLSFQYKNETRLLSVFENYIDDDTQELVTSMNIGMWGSSVKLMMGILESFGGYIKENDCEDEWKYVSPLDKTHMTNEEVLEDKLYEKLKDSEISFVIKQQIIIYVKSNLDFIKTL
jgi:hypothetical protein